MKYRINYITRDMKAHCSLTTEKAYKLYKSWWLVMNVKKNDPLYEQRCKLRKLFDKLGVIYVATHKSYHPKFNKKYRTMLSQLTAKVYEDNRLIVLPPLKMCKKNSISNITKILKQDLDASYQYGPFLPESLKPIFGIPLKNGSLKKILQSGKSYMRRKILSPKVHAIRIQILCDPKLPSDCIILPKMFAKYLQVYDYNLVEPGQYEFYNLEDFQELRSDIALLLKRDPVIHAASITLAKLIAFSNYDVMHIPSQIMEAMHADIDGDALIAYIIRSALAVTELKLFLNQQDNILLPNQTTRLNCPNGFALYMYKRHLPKGHRYYDMFEFARACVKELYLKNKDYMNSFYKLKEYHPDLTIDDIDPTSKILKHFLHMLCVLKGDNEAYLFINELNLLIYELSVGKHNGIYDPKLPMCYFFSSSLTCKNLRAVILSEAKGSIEHWINMIERKVEFDGTIDFQKYSNDHEPDQKQVLQMDKFIKIITQMAISSESVPRHGYETYKNSNDWSSLQVYNGNIYYRGICLGSVEYFFGTPHIFSPDFVKYCLEVEAVQAQNSTLPQHLTYNSIEQQIEPKIKQIEPKIKLEPKIKQIEPKTKQIERSLDRLQDKLLNSNHTSKPAFTSNFMAASTRKLNNEKPLLLPGYTHESTHTM